MADIVYPGKNATPLNIENLPQNVDLHLYKGDFLEVFIEVVAGATSMPLGSYTAKCQFRKEYGSPAAVELDASIIEGTPDKARIYMSSATAATLEVGSYIWDFQLENEDGDVRTYFSGDVTVIDEVTR